MLESVCEIETKKDEQAFWHIVTRPDYNSWP